MPAPSPGAALPRLAAYLARGEARGLFWTPLRQRIMTLLWKAARPLGAYDIAAALGRSAKGTSSTSVYRVLKLLKEAGLVIPVASWNRHLVAPLPGSAAWLLLLCPVCRRCDCVPADALASALDRLARENGFRPNRHVIELIGICPGCRSG